MTTLGMVAILGAVWRILTILGRVTFLGMVTILRIVTIIVVVTILEIVADLGIFYHPKGWLLNIGFIESWVFTKSQIEQIVNDSICLSVCDHVSH